MEDESLAISSGITFIGIKTDQFTSMVDLFERVLGLAKTRSESGFVAFRTSTGQRVEVFDTSYGGKTHFTTGPVPGFEVSDFDQAVAWLDQSGLEILEPAYTSSSGTRWVHFRAYDGNVYEFVYHPDLQED